MTRPKKRRQIPLVGDQTGASGMASSFQSSCVTAGFSLQALVRVKPLTGKFQTVEQLLSEMAECIVCYKITGEDSFVCHLHTDSVSHLDHTLQRITPFADTNTSIIKTVEKKLPAL